MNAIQNILLISIILGFALIEWRSKRYENFNVTKDDTRLEAGMFFSLVLLIQPLIFFVVAKLGSVYFPEYNQAWAHFPVWVMVAILLVGDDMTQYWWHRLSHSPLLWPLHRAHHTAHYMSIRITYRNNFFYYAMMPGLWVSGVLIYMGFGNVYLAYVLVKLTVIMGAHCAVPWDAVLYRTPALRPLAWVLERVFSTPATHWAHHALTNDDGIGNYKGNFGNLLFIWDQLFGTAKFTRHYPSAVGLPDDLIYGKERWYVEMFYPLFQSKRAHSVLAPGGRAHAVHETQATR